MPPPANEAARLASCGRWACWTRHLNRSSTRWWRSPSRLCGTPISLLSLVDAHRLWFKANVGLPGTSETPRDIAFCAHAIVGDAPLVVPDAAADPRFHDNPLVIGEPGIRFYAGAPLTLGDGTRAGTLCVIDRRPRTLEPEQLDALQKLSAGQPDAGSAAIPAGTRRRAPALGPPRRSHAGRHLGVERADGRGPLQRTLGRDDRPHADELGPVSIDTWLDHAHPEDLHARANC